MITCASSQQPNIDEKQYYFGRSVHLCSNIVDQSVAALFVVVLMYVIISPKFENFWGYYVFGSATARQRLYRP